MVMSSAENRPGFVRKPASQPKFGIVLASAKAPQQPKQPVPSKQRPRSSRLKPTFRASDALFPKQLQIVSLEGLRVATPGSQAAATTLPAIVKTEHIERPPGTEGQDAQAAPSLAQPLASQEQDRGVVQEGPKRRAVEYGHAHTPQATGQMAGVAGRKPLRIFTGEAELSSVAEVQDDQDSDSSDGAEWRRHALNSAQSRREKLEGSRQEAAKQQQGEHDKPKEAAVSRPSVSPPKDKPADLDAPHLGDQQQVPGIKQPVVSHLGSSCQPSLTHESKLSPRQAVKPEAPSASARIPASVRGRQFEAAVLSPFSQRPAEGPGAWKEYQEREVFSGVGFSTKLMDLTEEHSRFAYPTPSEALNSARTNPKLQMHVQDVSIVGCMPPVLDENFMQMQQMKRAWLMKFNDAEEQARDEKPKEADCTQSGESVAPTPEVDAAATAVLPSTRGSSDDAPSSNLLPPLSSPHSRGSVHSHRDPTPQRLGHSATGSDKRMRSASIEAPNHFHFVLETLRAGDTPTAVQSTRADSSDPWSRNLEKDATAALALMKRATPEGVRSHQMTSPRTPWSNTMQLGLFGDDAQSNSSKAPAASSPRNRNQTGEHMHRGADTGSRRPNTMSPLVKADGRGASKISPRDPGGVRSARGAGYTSSITEPEGYREFRVELERISSGESMEHDISAQHFRPTPSHTIDPHHRTTPEVVVSNTELIPMIEHKVIDLRGRERPTKPSRASLNRQPAPPRLPSEARRQQAMNQMRHKQDVGRGNKLVIKAKGEIARMDLIKARATVDMVRDAFATIGGKEFIIDGLEEDLRAAEERQKAMMNEDRTPTPPPAPRLAKIKVSLRGADRVQPDGMPHVSRAELNARHQAKLEAEREREEEEKQTMELSRKREEEMAAVLEEEESKRATEEEGESLKAGAESLFAETRGRERQQELERQVLGAGERGLQELERQARDMEEDLSSEDRRMQEKGEEEVDKSAAAGEEEDVDRNNNVDTEIVGIGSYELELFKNQDIPDANVEAPSQGQEERIEKVESEKGITAAEAAQKELRAEVDAILEKREKDAADVLRQTEEDLLMKEVELEVVMEIAQMMLDEAEEHVVGLVARDLATRLLVFQKALIAEHEATLQREAVVEEERQKMEEKKKRIEEEMEKMNAHERQDAEAWKAKLQAEQEQMKLEVEEQEAARQLEAEREEEELRRIAIEANEKQEMMAVGLLQAHARSVQSRRDHCRLFASALTLQAAMRGQSQRWYWVESVTAGRVVQWPLKRMCCRNEFQNMSEGITALQAAWRRRGTRIQYSDELEAVLCLQGWLRELASRREHACMVESSAVLQTNVRGILGQRAWQARGRSSGTIVAMCKQCVARRYMRAMFASSLVVQAAFKRLAVKDVAPTLAATETLVAKARAHLARNTWIDTTLAIPRIAADLKRGVEREGYRNTIVAARLLYRAYERSRDMEEYISELSDLIAEERAEAERQRKAAEAEEKRIRDEEMAEKLGAEFLAKMLAQEEERRKTEQAKLQHQKTQMQQMLDWAKRSSPMGASSPINRSPLASIGSERSPRSPHRRRHRVVESHKQAFIQAVQLEQEERWPEAIHAFTKIEHVPPYRIMCLLKRAICFSKVGMRRDAETDLETAAREFDDETSPFFTRALLRVQWKMIEEALDDLKETLIRDPQHVESLTLRAKLLHSMQRFSDAALDCTRVLHLKENTVSLLLLRAVCSRQLGKHRRALDDYEKAVKLVINNVKESADSTRSKKGAKPIDDNAENSAKFLGDDESEETSTDGAGFEVLTREILVGMCESSISDGQAPRAEAILTDLMRVNKDTEHHALTLALRGRVRCFKTQFSEAESDLEEAFKLDPEDSSVLLYRALYYRSSNLPTALNDLATAVEINDKDYAAQLARGKLLESLKDSPGALVAFSAAMPAGGAIGLEAKLRAGELTLKLAGGREEEVEKAWKILREAARIHAPDPTPWAHLARLQEVSWRPKEALRAVCKALHLSPHDQALYALRSRLQQALGRKEPTLRDWWAGLECKPDATVQDTKQKALIMMRLGRAAWAVEKLHASLAQNPTDAELAMLLGRALHETGDVNGAKVRFDDAVASEPSNPDLRGSRGMFLQKLGRCKDAREDLDIALGSKPEQLDWRASRAAALRELQLIDEAIRDCNLVLAGRPSALKTRLLRGIMHEKLQDFTAAIADYDEVVEALEVQPRGIKHVSVLLDPSLDPEEQRTMRIEASLKRGMLHSKRKNFGAAIQDYNRVLSLQPGCRIAMLHRGIAFHSHGYHESAISDYNKCLELQPDLLAALQNRATALMALKRHSEALVDLDRVPADDRDASYWLLVAICMRVLHRYEEALEAATSSLAIQNSLNAQLLCADLHAIIEPFSPQSLRVYQRAVRAFPASRLARFKLGLALVKHGHPDAAAEQVKAGRLLCSELWRGDEGGGAEELDAMLLLEDGNAAQAVNRMDVLLRNYRERGGDEKGLAELLTLRGVVLERMDDCVGARRDYQQALRVDAKCEEALYNLGCLLINQQEWRAAKDTLDKAIHLRPSNEFALLNRSVVLYQLKNPAEAIKDLDKVIALKPKLGHAFLNRGVIRMQQGRKTEAEKDLTTAVELIGTSKITIEARLKLFVGNHAHQQAMRDVAVLLHLEDEPDEALQDPNAQPDHLVLE